MAKVLLVEDDQMIQRIYERAFTEAGFTVELAENGQIGLEKVATFQPDIVVADVMMPLLNGVELLQKLRADPLTHALPVVLLTNVDNITVINEALSQGAAHYITKSDRDPKDVVTMVHGMLPAAAEGAAHDATTPAPGDPNHP